MATGRADFWYGRPFLLTDVPDEFNTQDAPTANWAYNHAVNPSAHHARYSDAEAVLAMGTIGNLNPLNHNRYNDGEAQDAMGVVANYNPMNHDRYADSEADARIALHSTLASAHHNAFIASEADVMIATHAAIAAAHHTRYADSEAVTAMGAKANANPLNHDRYTDSEAQAACLPAYIDRGDPAAFDKTSTDFTKDYNWYDLDLSAMVVSGAKAAVIKVLAQTTVAGGIFKLRKNGSAQDVVGSGLITQVAGLYMYFTLIVAVDTNGKCEYMATPHTWTYLELIVIGSLK